MPGPQYYQPPPQSSGGGGFPGGGFPAGGRQQSPPHTHQQRPKVHPMQQRQAPYQQTPQQQQQQQQPQQQFTGFKLAGAGNPAPEAQTRSVAAPGRKRWTVAQLRASDAIIPLQSGTNQFASQAGMTGFGRPRNNTTPVFGNILDTINPDPNAVPDTVIPLQYGTNQYASQRGMTGFGQPRDVTGKHLHRLHEDDPDFVPDPSQGQW